MLFVGNVQTFVAKRKKLKLIHLKNRRKREALIEMNFNRLDL